MHVVAWTSMGVIYLIRGSKRIFPRKTIYYKFIFYEGKLQCSHFYGDETRRKNTLE